LRLEEYKAILARMVILLGAHGFGLVLGWVTAYLAHHSRPGWREFKAALGVLLGATIQALFNGRLELALYAVGVIMGAALYGLTLIVKPLRRTHNFIIFPPGGK
jgi:hypothetical protein